MYVKNAHKGVIPGLDEFVAEYTSEEAFGEGGYLSERGLIPLPEDQRATIRDASAAGTAMAAPAK
jgi:phosphate transport system substrate-binding protein